MRDKITAKNSLCQDPGTNENDPLIKAAKVITDTFKSPIEFLHFLNDALGWVYDYGIAAGDSHPGETHFILRQFVQEIATPWLIGGEDVLSNMADGVGEVASVTSFSDPLANVKYLIRANTWFCSEMGSSNLDLAMLDAEGIICLMTVASCIHQYQLIKKTSVL